MEEALVFSLKIVFYLVGASLFGVCLFLLANRKRIVINQKSLGQVLREVPSESELDRLEEKKWRYVQAYDAVRKEVFLECLSKGIDEKTSRKHYEWAAFIADNAAKAYVDTLPEITIGKKGGENECA